MNDHPTDRTGANDGKAGGLVSAAAPVPSHRDPYYSGVGVYTEEDTDAASDLQLNLLKYLRILIKRRWLIVSIVGASVVIGGLVTLMKTPLYTSTVRLQIDQAIPKIIEGGSVMPIIGSDREFMRTQYELLQGPAIAQRVVSALRLGENANFLRPRRFSITAFVKRLLGLDARASDHGSQKINREGAAEGVVMANRAVRPVAGSRLVDVSYSDPSPARAQEIAEAYAKAFIASNLDKRFEANSYAKVFLKDRLQQLKLRLEQSEKALLNFGQKQQIVQTDNKGSIAETNLASANAALDTLVAERIKNEQLWKQVQGARAIDMPQLLSNGIIDALLAKRSTLETEYQEKLETFKPGYPAMVQLSSQIADINRQLAAEVKTLKQSYRAAYQASLDQETNMRKRVALLKQGVLDFQKRSIEYNILKREVDTNRSLYDSVLQRYKQVDVASGTGENNVFIVDKATLPGAPSSPNLRHALILSLALGLAGAFGIAFVLDKIEDTLETPEDAERSLGYATLGVIPKIRSGMSLDKELADPGSHLSEAYRWLRTALQLSTAKGLPKTLLVTSTGPGEGKTTTCLALAQHFARVGFKVLLVDADLRKPTLHTRLFLDNSAGLSNYLKEGARPPDLFQRTNLPNLAFMASGPLPSNAADLLDSSRLLSLFSVGLQVFDLIVVDSPPIMGLADAPLLSSLVEGTILVVGAGQVRTRFIRAALKRLRFSRATIIGTILTGTDATNGYGHYGYSYDFNRWWATRFSHWRANRSVGVSEEENRSELPRAAAE